AYMVPGEGRGLKPPNTYSLLLATAHPPGMRAGEAGQLALGVKVPSAGVNANVLLVTTEPEPEAPKMKASTTSGQVRTPPAMLEVLASGRVAPSRVQLPVEELKS